MLSISSSIQFLFLFVKNCKEFLFLARRKKNFCKNYISNQTHSLLNIVICLQTFGVNGLSDWTDQHMIYATQYWPTNTILCSDTSHSSNIDCKMYFFLLNALQGNESLLDWYEHWNSFPGCVYVIACNSILFSVFKWRMRVIQIWRKSSATTTSISFFHKFLT